MPTPGWWPISALALLTVAAATIALVSQQLTLSSADNAGPDEGFYWSVAQYQIAHQRLKQELRAIAAGERPNEAELERREAVLASKASILTEPSEVRNLLNGVPGYADATSRVAGLQRRIGPVLAKKPFTQSDAIAVLREFSVFGDDELLSQLANDVRLAELSAKDDMMRSLTLRLRWVWSGLALCWSALALWLYSTMRSRRRFAAAAADRQRAVLAMEQATASKRKFLSMVSHEVRSPLQNIVASTELLASKQNLPDSTAAIRRIQRAVTVLQGQLRDLLTIARSDSEHMPTQMQIFDFGELVRDVCGDFEQAALAKGLAFRVNVAEALIVVEADPIRIGQVLRNLVENAVRYTSSGFVEVRIDPDIDPRDETGVPLAAVQPAKQAWVRFAVTDSGPGLAPRASERLRQVTVPFESGNDGTGIGLFVIRDVLHQLGGRIEVQTQQQASAGDQGTAISVSIPVTLVEDFPSNLKDDLTPEATDALRILIVDDRPDVLLALSEVTRRLGHACATVGSAAEAHLLLIGTAFDAVLIDLDMPGTDGLALATEIRQSGGLNGDSMLVLISAAENQAVGQTWPFDAFLQKPIDGPALSRLIGSRTLQ